MSVNQPDFSHSTKIVDVPQILDHVAEMLEYGLSDGGAVAFTLTTSELSGLIALHAARS